MRALFAKLDLTKTRAGFRTAGERYEAHVYPGVQHGFNNDTTPRYDEAAAMLAWGRTVAFFKTHLRS